ncbi:MAG: TolC family protein [Deltaproteobacteria bacterium]|nr:TolC family protein [Deltaproteobacteria bacterium]
MVLRTVVVAALLAAGCATSPAGPSTRPASPPPSPGPAGGLPISSAAVPDPATTERLSLGQLLAYANRHAPLIQVAQRRAAAGAAEVEAASPLLQDNPEVGLSAGGKTMNGNTWFQLEASVEQRFEIAGERGLRIEAAEQLEKLSGAQLDEARWEVHRQIHGLFSEALMAGEQLAAAARLLAFAEELRAIAEKRATAGDTPPFTELVARAEVAQARQAHTAARQQRDAVMLQLAEVAGWPTTKLPPLAGTLPPVRKAPPLPELLAKAQRHQPGQRSRALALSAAQAQARLEDREAWPEPALGFAYGREGEADGAAHVWVGTLSLPLPIWNRNQAGRARARANVEVARAERDAAASWLSARLVRAATAVDAAAERVTIYGEAIAPAFDRNLKLIRRAYDLGEIDIHRVSQIRERILSTQQQALAALADYHQAVASLEALLGTEVWSAEATQPEAAP